MSTRRMNRRDFVSTAATAGATLALSGLSLGGAAAQEQEIEERNIQPEMTYRVLPGSNMKVSCLAYGSVRLSADRVGVLEMLVERGLNTVHVGETYLGGQAMAALGTFCKTPGNRDRIFILYNGDVDAGLEALGTDYLDVVCYSTQDPGQAGVENIRESFEGMREKGKVRYLNLTAHANPVQVAQVGLECGFYHNMMPTLDLSNLEDFTPTLAAAKENNVGVVAMKSMRNANEATPQQVVRGLLAAGVTSVVKTLDTVELAEAFLDAVKEEVATHDLDKALHLGQQAIAVAGTCTLCGACSGCPQSVDVQGVLRNYLYYHKQQGMADIAAEKYAEIPMRQTALACQSCGTCERACPQRLPVRQLIREAHEVIVA